jgi:hypothetical protein
VINDPGAVQGIPRTHSNRPFRRARRDCARDPLDVLRRRVLSLRRIACRRRSTAGRTTAADQCGASPPSVSPQLPDETR